MLIGPLRVRRGLFRALAPLQGVRGRIQGISSLYIQRALGKGLGGCARMGVLGLLDPKTFSLITKPFRYLKKALENKQKKFNNHMEIK